MGDLWATYGRPMGDLWVTYGRPMGDLWDRRGDDREISGRFGGGFWEILGRFLAKRQGKLTQFLRNPSKWCIFVADSMLMLLRKRLIMFLK